MSSFETENNTHQSYRFGNARLSLSRLGTGLTDVRMIVYTDRGSARLNYLITAFERERFLGIILGKMKEQLRHAMTNGRDVQVEEMGL